MATRDVLQLSLGTLLSLRRQSGTYELLLGQLSLQTAQRRAYSHHAAEKI